MRWAITVGLAAVPIVLYYPTYGTNSRFETRGYEPFAIAKSIATKGTFSDPFMPLGTGPSAHCAPLYPAYLALILKVFGNGSTAVGVHMWIGLLMLAAQLSILPWLTRHLGLGFWTGVIAALAWLACGTPPGLFEEQTFAGLLVTLATFQMQTSFTEEMSVGKLTLAGTTWGALLLLQTAAVLILLFWILLLHYRSRASLRQKAVLALLPLIVVMPWIVRNFVVFHKPVFVRDNLGLELAVSNNACANASFEVNWINGCFALFHPNENFEEALKVQQMGEVEYNRARMKEAISWIKDNPATFFDLTLQRFEAFWFPRNSVSPGNGLILRPWVLAGFTLLSIPGLFFMWRNARVSSYVAGLWLLFYPLIYYFVHFMARYRYPILWATFVPGSYFIVELMHGIVGKEEVKSKPPSAA
jgi:hypothetical protein